MPGCCARVSTAPEDPAAGTEYAVAPDARRFLMMKEDERQGHADAAHVIIVRNWVEELKRLAPPNHPRHIS